MSSAAFAGEAPPLVYSEVMEDGDVVAEALATRPGDTVVVVASAGDNVFRAALEPCAQVHGVDLNPTQVDLCRLKAAAIRELEWAEFAALVGSIETKRDTRASMLKRLPSELVERALPDQAARDAALEGGFATAGRLAAFVAPLRAALTSIVGAETLERIVRTTELAERRRIWTTRFDTPALDDLLATALNEDTISDAFIPAWAFGRMAEPRFDRHYKRVLEHLFVELEPATNPYLQRLWLGRVLAPDVAQRYLKRESYKPLRDALPRIEWHAADLLSFLAELPPRSVEALNLSNILDWSDDAHHERLWAETERVAAGRGRVFLRSFLAQRDPPAEVRAGWTCDARRSERMRAADRVGYFSRYELWSRRA
ncbi:MAG: BtaA family protein [Planctomycetes bacterium]|nr:BtaA family protein [Planctomycetota bacterium]